MGPAVDSSGRRDSRLSRALRCEAHGSDGDVLSRAGVGCIDESKHRQRIPRRDDWRSKDHHRRHHWWSNRAFGAVGFLGPETDWQWRGRSNWNFRLGRCFATRLDIPTAIRARIPRDVGSAGFLLHQSGHQYRSKIRNRFNWHPKPGDLRFEQAENSGNW